MHVLADCAFLCLGAAGGFLAALFLLHARAQSLAEEIVLYRQGAGARNDGGRRRPSLEWESMAPATPLPGPADGSMVP